MRKRGTQLAAVLATTVAALVTLAAAPGAPAERLPATSAQERCGTVPVYDHRLPLEARGAGCPSWSRPELPLPATR